MKKLVFETDWKVFFERHGLRTFEDFFQYQQGNVINQNTKRNVLSFDLTDDHQTVTFFMKRFHQPHFKDMLFTFRNYGIICSQAELEWRNAHRLLDHHIETYHPVAFGAHSACGIERQSFFITRQINGQCLLDYLIQCGGRLTPQQMETLVVKLAQFFRKIHAAGFNLPDSYIWHIYMIQTPESPQQYELGMIDLHRMKIHSRTNRQAAMNLGRFLFSLPEALFDAKLRDLFIDSYLDSSNIRNHTAFVGHIKKWETKLSKRRKKKTITPR